MRQPPPGADQDTHELDELVRRTTGAQPWRKAFHALNGLIVAGALTWVPLSERMVMVVLAAILGGQILLDVVRLTNEAAQRLFFRAFSALASPREAHGVASSTWYTLGILLSVTFFRRDLAVSGVLVLGLADPMASYLGQRWGRTPFLGGTVLGSVTFLIVSAVVLGVRHPALLALPTAMIVTVAERRSWPLDDNLTIPLACAATLAALGALT